MHKLKALPEARHQKNTMSGKIWSELGFHSVLPTQRYREIKGSDDHESRRKRKKALGKRVPNKCLDDMRIVVVVVDYQKKHAQEKDKNHVYSAYMRGETWNPCGPVIGQMAFRESRLGRHMDFIRAVITREDCKIKGEGKAWFIDGTFFLSHGDASLSMNGPSLREIRNGVDALCDEILQYGSMTYPNMINVHGLEYLDSQHITISRDWKTEK